jgi:hypothetical protein
MCRYTGRSNSREHAGQMQDSTNSARWLEGTRAPTGELRQDQLRADPLRVTRRQHTVLSRGLGDDGLPLHTGLLHGI